MLGDGFTSPNIEHNSALTVQALIPNQTIRKKKEGLDVTIIENHIIFETIAEKFMKNQLI